MATTLTHIAPWQAGLSCREFAPERLRPLVDAGVTVAEVLPSEVTRLSPDARATRLREIAQIVRDVGLSVWSVHIPFGGAWDISYVNESRRAGAVAHVREMFEFCRMLSPRKAIIHPSGEPIDDTERPARMVAARASLRQLVGDFTAAGIQLAVENLPRTCLGNTAEEMLELTDGIDGLGICFDTNHLLKQTHEHFLDKLAGRIVSLHCSDYDGVDERHWIPGDGIVPWNLVTTRLKAAGYAGPFMFEAWKYNTGTPANPADYPRVLQQLLR